MRSKTMSDSVENNPVQNASELGGNLGAGIGALICIGLYLYISLRNGSFHTGPDLLLPLVICGLFCTLTYGIGTIVGQSWAQRKK
ncbi:MAG: hypothetical protein JWN90_293 [Parcubacteria group bacterium]|nr:hypothetical protein [Parcubacteria group bacterium]